MEDLVIHQRPNLENPPMVLGFTGWMDGGRVSTGTIAYLDDKLDATTFAEIKPADFYILHFPVSTIPISLHTEHGRAVLTSVNPMEFAAVFRPHTKITDGIIEELTYAQNEFSCSEGSNLMLFTGEEPHLRWAAYCECLFEVAEQFGVEDIYFVGSVAGSVPHTREPRIRASVRNEALKPGLADAGVEYSDYEGPASIVTALTYESVERGINMRSLVVEVPHYPFLEMSTYPKSILRVTSALNILLGLSLDLTDLQDAADAADTKLNAAMEDHKEFRELVHKLEETYDSQEPTPDKDLLKRLLEGIDLDGNGEQE
jgi:proteasome assembly chaperone (PAC2) family protein